MSTSREAMIQLQKSWIEDLKDQIYDAENRDNPELDEYYQEYRQQFQTGFERFATRKELARQLERADIAYFGDFHTLKIAQKTVVTLLRDLRETWEKPIILGLEMVHTEHQVHIDAFMQGRMTEAEFLDAIQYQKRWGFEWSHFRQFFDFAREASARVIGLNTLPKTKVGVLRRRDRHAARLIAAASQIFPESLVAVIFGDLHLAQRHLPAEVGKALRAGRTPRRTLTIYQNSETYYWQLVAQEKELLVDAVKMKNGVYCIMNATPLVKFQSWANWLERGGEFEIAGISSLSRESHAGIDLSDQFGNVTEAIVEALGLEHEGLEDFELYSTGDMEFLDELVEEGIYSANDAQLMREIIAARRSAYFPRARVVYLGSLSINVAADLASRFIYYTFTGEEHTEGVATRNAFYVAVLIEAIGVYGTLLLNPRFRVKNEADHQALLERLKGKRKLTEEQKRDKVVSRCFLEHEATMQRMLETEWARNNLRSMYHLEPSEFRFVTRAIGAYLGNQLYIAENERRLPEGTIQTLFTGAWDRDKAYDYYLSLLRKCHGGRKVRGEDQSL